VSRTLAQAAPALRVRLLDGGAGVAYLERGQGPLVLLVHGSLCDARFWQPQAAGLAAHRHVVAPSLSHYHPVLPSAMQTPFGWQPHAAQVVAFALSFGEPVHLLGHSRGGCIAFHAALALGERLASLALVDTAGPTEDDPPGGDHMPDAIVAQRREAARWIAEGDIERGLEAFVDSTSEPGIWRRSPPGFQQMARDNAATLIPQMADPLPPYRAVDAARIAVPSLLVNGALSPPLFGETLDWLASRLPDARRATIAGASHGMTTTHAGAFNRVYRHFLDGVGAG